MAALLAAMLSLERLFRDDFGDGALEQMMLMPHPLGLLALAKVIAHWLLTGLPLLLISPLLAILLSLDMNTYLAVVATLALGTPVLSLLGAVGVALTVGLRKGVLLSLLILPLYIPVLILPPLPSMQRGWGCPIRGSWRFWGHAGRCVDPDPAGGLGGAASQRELTKASEKWPWKGRYKNIIEIDQEDGCLLLSGM